MALDKITTDIIADDAVTAAKIPADAIGISELSATGTASSTTFLRGDNAWSAGTPSIVDNGNATAITIDSSEDVTYTGNIIMPTNKKIKAKGEFMTHSLHRSWVMGG